jgi:NAD(P)-dependent dehydrogenase (short-subunit alcohol dehydrogenase family)
VSIGNTSRTRRRQLREAAAALRRAGGDVTAYAADVGDPEEAAGLINASVATYGGIDILVNNVGGGGGGARIADSSDEDWRGALERNLIQTVRMMRLALAHMKGRPGRWQRLGPLPARQPRVFRRLRASWFSDGPARHRRGSR